VIYCKRPPDRQGHTPRWKNHFQNHQILKVKRRNGENFIVVGEKDWNAIEETLYLNQFPDLVKSIHDAHREPLEKGTALEDLDW